MENQLKEKMLQFRGNKMNKTILIPYLHQFGEEVILGNKENKRKDKKEFFLY